MKSVVIDCLKTFKQSRFDKLTFFAIHLCLWEQCIRRVVPIKILVFCWTYYTSLHLIKYLTFLLTNVLFEFLLFQSIIFCSNLLLGRKQLISVYSNSKRPNLSLYLLAFVKSSFAWKFLKSYLNFKNESTKNCLKIRSFFKCIHF